MILNNVAFGKHQERFEQMSIYDFLPEEKSQEVQPSESVPQVDEAPKLWEMIIATDNEFHESALDTRASNTLDIETYEAIVEECEESFQPTEDTDNVGSESSTDSTLFSVGDVVKVIHPAVMYDMEKDPESFYYLDELYGEELTVENLGKAYLVASGHTLYYKEVIKI